MKNFVTYKTGVFIFRPGGRITGHTSKQFREYIFEALPVDETSPRILFDFDGVKMMDSTGLGAMMEIQMIVKKQKGRIGVINVGSHINNLLVISHLVSQFEHFDSENDAILRLREPHDS